MNHDINELLEAASADVREVDFAERAWTGAHRRRSRRQVITGVAAAAAVAVAFGTYEVGTPNTAPPANPVPSITQPSINVAWKTAADETKYVVAPALGTESTLRRSGPAGLESVDPTAPQRKLADVFAENATTTNPVFAAVYLEAADGADYAGATSFQPVYVLDDGSLVGSGLKLGWVRDSGGNRSVPLSADAMSAGRWAAFAQPGKVVVMNLRTGTTQTFPVPSQTIERVRWSAANTVVASGDEGAWSIDVEASSARAVKLPQGYTGANESITVDPSKGTTLTSWKLDGLQKEETPFSATADSTTGQTFSSNLDAATAVVLYNGVPMDGAYQGILAIPLANPTTGRLLVMGETPARQKACCQVAGFLDERTPLYTDVTAEGVWLLAWNTETGDVRRAFLLEANPAVPPVLSYGLSVR